MSSIQLPADIWVVIATIGEYSDRHEWTVRAFTSAAAAEAFIEDRSPKVREALLEFARQEDRWFSDEITHDTLDAHRRVLESALDFPGLKLDEAHSGYSGVRMHYEKVELV